MFDFAVYLTSGLFKSASFLARRDSAKITNFSWDSSIWMAISSICEEERNVRFRSTSRNEVRIIEEWIAVWFKQFITCAGHLVRWRRDVHVTSEGQWWRKFNVPRQQGRDLRTSSTLTLRFFWLMQCFCTSAVYNQMELFQITSLWEQVVHALSCWYSDKTPNLRSDGRSGVVLSSLKPAAMNRGRLSTKLGSFLVPLSFSRSSDPRSGDGLAQASHHKAVWTKKWGPIWFRRLVVASDYIHRL